MIDLIGRNKVQVGINADLNSFSTFRAHPSFVLCAFFLKQLHLPQLNWGYDAYEKTVLLQQEPDHGIQLDQVLIQSLESRDLVKPEQVYTWFLLSLYLNIQAPLSFVYQIPAKRSRLLFGMAHFDCDESLIRFQKNEMIPFIKTLRNQKRLMESHESFFVLMKNQRAEKVQTVLVEYETKIGKKLERSAWLAYCLDPNRLQALKQFSEQLIRSL